MWHDEGPNTTRHSSGPPNWEEGRWRGGSKDPVLSHVYASSKKNTHARTFLSFTTCTVQLQGSFSLSQTTQPNKHIQLHLLLTFSPCSSRSRSHSLHWGREDYRWVKFTSLRKLFDITNKVKVYQKTPEDYIMMVCRVARCTSRSKKKKKNSRGFFPPQAALLINVQNISLWKLHKRDQEVPREACS